MKFMLFIFALAVLTLVGQTIQDNAWVREGDAARELHWTGSSPI